MFSLTVSYKKIDIVIANQCLSFMAVYIYIYIDFVSDARVYSIKHKSQEIRVRQQRELHDTKYLNVCKFVIIQIKRLIDFGPY